MVVLPMSKFLQVEKDIEQTPISSFIVGRVILLKLIQLLKMAELLEFKFLMAVLDMETRLN